MVWWMQMFGMVVIHEWFIITYHIISWMNMQQIIKNDGIWIENIYGVNFSRLMCLKNEKKDEGLHVDVVTWMNDWCVFAIWLKCVCDVSRDWCDEVAWLLRWVRDGLRCVCDGLRCIAWLMWWGRVTDAMGLRWGVWRPRSCLVAHNMSDFSINNHIIYDVINYVEFLSLHMF